MIIRVACCKSETLSGSILATSTILHYQTAPSGAVFVCTALYELGIRYLCSTRDDGSMAKDLLSARSVLQVKKVAKPYRLLDGEGLTLFVATTGVKSW
jgi:hypothetical protein